MLSTQNPSGFCAARRREHPSKNAFGKHIKSSPPPFHQCACEIVRMGFAVEMSSFRKKAWKYGFLFHSSTTLSSLKFPNCLRISNPTISRTGLVVCHVPHKNKKERTPIPACPRVFSRPKAAKDPWDQAGRSSWDKEKNELTKIFQQVEPIIILSQAFVCAANSLVGIITSCPMPLKPKPHAEFFQAIALHISRG